MLLKEFDETDERRRLPPGGVVCCVQLLPGKAISRLHSKPGNQAPQYLYSAAMATTETMFPDQSDFNYDYDTLRTTGVILAAIMSITGIVIALSK
ncbi:hypothetical protein D4764_10G0003910 [Takifugu flavidus]|uniref:FXYD domain-containing ion transport regulator n=1 Tax=Takifugu flavidus TaxID=433684 RepID=A0A5C6PK89_9TELE|nr:hypothetical protein D4764_10G0003910 [Takifugu flavidus]